MLVSGTCIGYLPTHHANMWVSRGLLRLILPARLAYSAAFHCIARQGQTPKGAPKQFLGALFTARQELKTAKEPRV